MARTRQIAKTKKSQSGSKNIKKKTVSAKVIKARQRAKSQPKTKSNPSDLSTLFKRLKDDLRLSDDHVTGRDAVMAISQLVTLYLLEDTDKIEHFGLSDDVKFSVIYEACQKNSFTNKTKERASKIFFDIFTELKENEFTSQAYQQDPPYTKYTTFRKLIVEIYQFFDKIDKKQRRKLKEKGDILGQEYEELLRTQLVGRDDGQYFTNRNAVKMIVEQIDPKIGETIYDPTCGTGGFIIYSYLHIRNKLKEKYTNFENGKSYTKLCNDTFYGCDLDSKVMEILHSNLILHDIKHNKHFRNCNTIKENIKRDKYDVVVSNYPFGKKGGNIFSKDASENKKLLKYYGCKSTVLPLLFLKHTINILKEGGRAGVIVTTGELTNTGRDYKFFREDIVENNTLTKIIILPKGLFENAKGVSTAVICFTKGGRTTEVEFYDVPNIKCDEVNLVRKVKRVAIKKEGYSLDPATYDNADDVDYGDIPMKKLGDVFEFKSGKFNTNEMSNTGEYPFYNSSINNPCGTHNKYCFEGKSYILMNKAGGNTHNRLSITNGLGKVFYVKGKSAGRGSVLQLISNNKKYDINYLYCILQNMEIKIKKMAKYTTGLGTIRLEKIKEIKIPIPPIHIQKKIVEFLDPLFGQNNSFTITQLGTYFDKIDLLKMLFNQRFIKFKEIYDTYTNILNTEKQINAEKQFMRLTMGSVIKFPHEMKKLGDVIQVETGKYIKKSDMVEGKYDIYGGGDASGKNNTYNRKDKLIIAKDGVSEKCVRYVEGKFFLNHHGWTFNMLEDTNIKEKYVNYFLLNNQDRIYSLAKGTAQKGINQDNFYNKIQIPIPSIQHQKQIIEEMEKKENLIKTLEKSISDAKTNIEIIMNGYLKGTKKESDNEQTKKKKSKKKIKEESEDESSDENQESDNEESVEKTPKKKSKKIKKKDSDDEESHEIVEI